MQAMTTTFDIDANNSTAIRRPRRDVRMRLQPRRQRHRVESTAGDRTSASLSTVDWLTDLLLQTENDLGSLVTASGVVVDLAATASRLAGTLMDADAKNRGSVLHAIEEFRDRVESHLLSWRASDYGWPA